MKKLEMLRGREEKQNGFRERLNFSQTACFFKAKRNFVTFLMNKARYKFYNELIEENARIKVKYTMQANVYKI